MYLCTVFGLYSALRNVRSPLRNVHSSLRNVDPALRNMNRIPALWKCKQVMRKNHNSLSQISKKRSYTEYPSGERYTSSLSISADKALLTVLAAFRLYFWMKAPLLGVAVLPSFASAFNTCSCLSGVGLQGLRFVHAIAITLISLRTFRNANIRIFF